MRAESGPLWSHVAMLVSEGTACKRLDGFSARLQYTYSATSIEHNTFPGWAIIPPRWYIERSVYRTRPDISAKPLLISIWLLNDSRSDPTPEYYDRSETMVQCPDLHGH